MDAPRCREAAELVKVARRGVGVGWHSGKRYVGQCAVGALAVTPIVMTAALPILFSSQRLQLFPWVRSLHGPTDGTRDMKPVC